MTRLRRLLRPRSLVVLAPFALMAPLYLGGKAMFWGTPLTQFVPWWHQAWETLRSGDLPLWNPLVGMGAPLLANYQSALFYPPTWSYFLLASLGGTSGMAWGQSLLVAAHLAWAGLGAAALARRLGWGETAGTASGLAFGLSGYLAARAHFLSINAAAAWLPWILLAAYDLAWEGRKSRSIVRLGLFLGLQLLAGHAQTAWYTLLLAAAWTAFWGREAGGWPNLWRAAGRFALALGIALALSAVQLLPTAEYLVQSQRAAAVDYEFALNYSFWPWRFLALLAPNLFGNPAHGDYWGYGNYWEDAVYVGLLGLLLALGGLLRRGKEKRSVRLSLFLVAVLLVSFLLALGKNTPVFPLLYRYVPTFDMFQAPTRFSLWAVVSLALLAGLGAEGWRRPEGGGLYWSRLGTAAAFAVSLGAGLAWFILRTGSLPFGEIEPTFILAVALAGFWGLGAGVLNLAAPPEGKNPPAAWRWAVGLWLAADLLVAAWGLNPGADLSLYRGESASAKQVRALADGGRLYLPPEDEQELKFERFLRFDGFSIGEPWDNLRAVLLPNTNMLDGIPSANNFDPLVPGRYARWMEALAAAPEAERAGMLARMGVALVERVDPRQPLGVRFEPLAQAARLRWTPCAYFARSGESAIDSVISGEFDPRETVVLEVEGVEAESVCRGEGEARIRLLNETPNEIAIQIDGVDSGWLILGDVWYPGWRTYVNGRRAPVLRADYLFRAVELGDGPQQVTFTYRPLPFYLGGLVSGLAWGAMVVYWYTVRRGRG